MTYQCVHSTQAVLAAEVPGSTEEPGYTGPETSRGCRDARR
jgi:hypothetical protein